MKPSNTSRLRQAQRGFALIVTLSLMILLTVIAVGLLTLSSISLRSSSRGEAGATARANARMALMMAIGELQQELGPDSRISAAADAGTIATGGQPHWTAVYDAWARPTDPNAAETPALRVPKFRSWLASGANAATGGPPGFIDPKTGKPATETLVGQGSLTSTALPVDQINVPMYGLAVGKNQGRIAWWVSDESSKAKLNAGAGAELASKPLFSAQSPPNVGHQAIPELKTFEWKPGQRAISISNGSVNLVAALGSRGIGNLNHDVTVHSKGVLADVRGGHLKRDLSNLLSRPITELENKPLYLADGRMSRFEISDSGVITNATTIPPSAAGANRWGINFEELHLFHEIHREVDWSSGTPRLLNKGSTTAITNDRFFMYRKPIMEAVSLILFLKASAEPGTAPLTYRIDATMDTIVALSNPNDIPTVWPVSVNFLVQTEGFPYRPQWNIRRAGAVRNNLKVDPINRGFFRASIKNGFTLEPGEAAVFGASDTDTLSTQVNLKRGFAPRGGVSIADIAWDSDNKGGSNVGLRATRLLPTDTMDFTMLPANTSNGNTPSGWIQSTAEISDASGGSKTVIATHRLGGGGNSALSGPPSNPYMPASIKPQGTSAPPIDAFVKEALPVLMVTTMSNVERSRTSPLPLTPNALPSRPYLIHEPATANMTAITNDASNLLLTMQNSQLVTIAESMDYKKGSDRTMPDSTGQNIFHGGAREPGLLGGSKYVVKRRIPLAAPLSLGAFENAIACGFIARIGPSLNATADILPTQPAPGGSQPKATKVTLAKSIGNSWTNPFLTSDVIQDGTYHDQSWMANTALWDSWFLSGVVKPGPSSAWNSDSRSQKQQFNELAASTAALRNGRLIYHPHKSSADAVSELFDGDNLKPAAINKLTNYLLVDGAFNVNSTSLAAWKAFLTSVRDQQLLDANGKAQPKTHPFGTMGYAAYDKTTKGYAEDWNGFRDLTDSEMNTLAIKIIDEVKARGPFLNMADFVNRRPNSSDATHRALGALQAAIDKSGVNDRFKTAGRTLAAADVPMLAGKDTLSNEPTAARAPGAAGLLSQGALLTAFGSQITVRGDTFLIRTYGDSRDAAGNLQAKAWCEAVVQRTPEFVDPTNPPETSANLSAANTTFGRKFNIVSFRWLSPNEI